MKLIVDIPDKMYETVQDGTYCGTLYEELKNGTPLSESEDCVSREAVKEIIAGSFADLEYFSENIDLRAEIDELPPVTPKQTFEGMTNGEVIKALFPDIGDYVKCGNILRFEPQNSKFIIAFGDDWWNAPYKASPTGAEGSDKDEEM